MSRDIRPAFLAATAVAVLVLSIAPATAAQAVDPIVTFEGQQSVSVEYGVYWEFPIKAHGAFVEEGPWVASVDFHGGPSSYEPGFYSYGDTSGSEIYGSVYRPDAVRPLGVGSYTMDVTVTSPTNSVTSESPASLVITPAALGITLRALPDPENASGLIVSAAFNGQFVDNYTPSFYGSAALSPAGEWHITIVDASGETAVERSFERTAGDDVLATSFYWAGAEPEADYAVTAEFVPTGDSAANFDIAPADRVTVTSSENVRPTPTSTATTKPATALPEPSGFSLPLWALILAGVIIVGLVTLVTIFSVRLFRRPVRKSAVES